MIGNIHKITKRNLLKGIPWRFGPNWPGQRCKAKTRRGTLCQRPAKLPVGRCRLHGGASTGPRTKDGLPLRHEDNYVKSYYVISLGCAWF